MPVIGTGDTADSLLVSILAIGLFLQRVAETNGDFGTIDERVLIALRCFERGVVRATYVRPCFGRVMEIEDPCLGVDLVEFTIITQKGNILKRLKNTQTI